MKDWIRKRASEMKDWTRKRIFEMKNRVWNYRIGLALLVMLLAQVPFVVFKITTADAAQRDLVLAIVETAQILLSSGLAVYLFSKAFELLLENWLYGKFRSNWKEVRVMYSDGFGKGTGEEYPRDPTLLLQPPVFGNPRPASPRGTDGDSLVAQSLDGKRHVITAPIVHGPVQVSFNTGYVGQSAVGEDTVVTGKWSDLQLMQVGLSGHRVTRVGFPDTLMETGQMPTRS